LLLRYAMWIKLLRNNIFTSSVWLTLPIFMIVCSTKGMVHLKEFPLLCSVWRHYAAHSHFSPRIQLMGHETKLYISHNFQSKNMWTHTSNSQYTFVARYVIISTHSHSYKYLGVFPVLFTNTPMISCAANRKTRCRQWAILFLNWEHRNEQVYVSSCCKSGRRKSVGNFSLSSCLTLHPSVCHSTGVLISP